MEGAGPGWSELLHLEGVTSVISWERCVNSFLDGASGSVDVHVRVRGERLVSVTWEVSLSESERSLWGRSLGGSEGISGSGSDHLSHLAGTESALWMEGFWLS